MFRLALLIIPILCSCKPNAEPAKEESHYGTKTIAFTKEDDSSPLGFWETKIEYPVLPEMDARHKKINEAIIRIAEEFKCDSEKGNKEFIAEVTLINTEIMSLKYSDSWYCEGMPGTQGRTGSATFNLITGNEINIDSEISENRTGLDYEIREGFTQALTLKDVDCPEPKPAYSYLTKKEIIFVNYSNEDDSIQCEVEAKIPYSLFNKYVKGESPLSNITK